MALTRLVVGCLMAATTALAVGSPARAEQRSLYVAPDGTGSACTITEPCDLAGAKAQVRTSAPTMTDDIVVNLLGGTYRLDHTIEFDAGDSGRNGHRVVYQAGTSQAPVLSGGRRISGWTRHDSTRDIWKAPVGDLQTRQLYVDGSRAKRARRGAGLPGTVAYSSAGHTTTSTLPQSWNNVRDIELVYNDGNGEGNWRWAEPRCPIASITGSSSSTTITMAQPCWGNVLAPRSGKVGKATDVENHYSFLDTAGEFYLDRSTAGGHVLYYKPRAGEDLATAEVVAPTLESAVRVTGTADAPVTDLVFRGITFADTTWLRPGTTEGFPEIGQNTYRYVEGGVVKRGQPPAGVEVRYARELLLERNRFQRMGGAGLTLGYGSRDNTAIGNVFTDLSSNGIQVGHPKAYQSDAELAARNLVSNNFVHAIGKDYPGAYAVWVATARDTTITHNELYDLPRGGIAGNFWYMRGPSSTSGTVASYNHIHHYMRVMRDGGGFDTNGMTNGVDGVQPGGQLIGNHFHNDHNPFGQIYFDLWTSGYTVTNNVAYDSKAGVLDYNTVPRDRWPCCNTHTHNYYEKAPDAKYIGNADMVLDTPTLAVSAMPVSIIRNAGLEPAYRDLLDTVSPRPPTGLPASNDAQPPTAPSGLKVTGAGRGPAVTVSWTGSGDNVGVTGYEVRHGETVVAAVTGSARSAGILGLRPGNSYHLVVRARDAAGNLSGPSNPITVTVKAPGDPSLIGHWTFDDVGGTTAGDSSGARNHATVTDPSWRTYGRIGAAMGFNGTSTAADAGTFRVHNMDRDSFTVAASFRTSGTGWKRIVSKGHYGDSAGYLLQYDSGAVTFGIGANYDLRGCMTSYKSALAKTPAQFSDNRWHQVSAVVDRAAGTIQVYVDGTAQPLSVPTATGRPWMSEDGKVNCSAPQPQPYCGSAAGTVLDISACPYLAASSNDPLVFGAYEAAGGGRAEHFKGEIDDVRLYDRALTPDEISDVVRLAGHWKFDEGAGTSTVDWTGNAGASPYTPVTGNWVAGPRGTALEFDGSGGVRLGDIRSLDAGTRSFSVATWFRSTATGWQRMVSNGHFGNTAGHLLQYDSGRVAFGVGADGTAGNATVFRTPQSFGDGQWHHAVAVVDRSAQTIRVYVDGVAQPLQSGGTYCGTVSGSTADISGCPLLNATSTGVAAIGSHDGIRENFRGALDDVRFYLAPLTEAEVQRLYAG